MAKHQTQHRPTRDTRHNKELSDLKRENQSLKRKIAKLQKYTQKLLETVQLAPEEDVVLLSPDVTPKMGLDSCPTCSNKGLTQITLPTGTMTVCKNCGWRKKNV